MFVSIFVYFLYSLSKKLEFAPIASGMTAVLIHALVLACNTRWLVTQPLILWNKLHVFLVTFEFCNEQMDGQMIVV